MVRHVDMQISSIGFLDNPWHDGGKSEYSNLTEGVFNPASIIADLRQQVIFWASSLGKSFKDLVGHVSVFRCLK